MPNITVTIAHARSATDIADVATLMRTYAASLDTDLCFQGFGAELAGLPGKYAPPSGALLIARDRAGLPVGCVALRALDKDGRCEMKRLYVTDAGRGQGLGARLVEALISEALAIGYREMLLDTLPSMIAAQALYRRLGFEEAAPYYPTPVAGTRFMRRQLVSHSTAR